MKKLISFFILVSLISALNAADDNYQIAKRRMGIANNVEHKSFTIINKTKYNISFRVSPVSFFINNYPMKTGFSESLFAQNGKIVFIDAHMSKTIELQDFIQSNGVLVHLTDAQYFKVVFDNSIDKKIFSGQSDWIKLQHDSNYIVTQVNSFNNEEDNIKLHVQVS